MSDDEKAALERRAEELGREIAERMEERAHINARLGAERQRRALRITGARGRDGNRLPNTPHPATPERD